jgi:hypothetical protein
MSASRRALSVIVFVILASAGAAWAQQEPAPEQPEAAPEQQEAVVEEPAAEASASEETAAAEPVQAPAAPATELETTVEFKLDGPVTLEGRVGDVEVRSIEFVRAPVKSNVIRGAFSSGNEDLKSEIAFRLSCATSADTKWKLDVMVELLDGDGTVIDRASNSGSLKNEAKIIDFKHTTLAWVVPQIDRARLSISAKQ